MKEKERKHLHLILKAKWYDMIEKGEKTAEYRDFKRYLWKFLIKENAKESLREKDMDELKQMVKDYCQSARDIAYGGDDVKREDFDVNTRLVFGNKQMYRYSSVTFHRGYTNTTMTFRIDKIAMGEGQLDWGAEDGEVYAILELGDRIDPEEDFSDNQ